MILKILEFMKGLFSNHVYRGLQCRPTVGSQPDRHTGQNARPTFVNQCKSQSWLWRHIGPSRVGPLRQMSKTTADMTRRDLKTALFQSSYSSP